MIRRAVLAAVLALLVLGASTTFATADDAPPTPPAFTPPPIPTPSDGASSGPTYVITPGVGGSELPTPSDPKDVAKAKQADQAQHHAGTGKHGSADPGTEEPGRASGETAGPQTPLAHPTSADKVTPVLRGFAALVAMVVLYEITAVRRSVFRRRRASVTAG
ncbi:hypothetical protein [Nocardioides marmorisolisilvae]|uniref:Uncharacterized protein n=1 Tax=Nocardioides marmorisolisilvae TaxID=1542737 RepID=A0A3N0DWU6_9ACTN|nr:hypothetical protein [Nocardioides marmorisolisilvae]RNL80088.1 hypothetical protein EFL95_14350 [Nocardioides marmorisolisilvae]